MSTPDSAQRIVLLPAAPRLSMVPDAVAALPAPVVAAAGLLAIQTAAFFAGRVLAVNLNALTFVDTTGTATALGAVSFMSIVVVAAALALAYPALRGVGGRAHQVAAIAFGVGLLHLVLWLTRVAAAAMAVSGMGSTSAFLPSIFWWG